MLQGAIISLSNSASMGTGNGIRYYTDKAGVKYSVNINHSIFQYLLQINYGDYLSLLNNLIFDAKVFEDSDVVKCLSGNERIDMKINLFFAIIQYHTNLKMKTSVFIL